jgi:hypothetical protein
MIASGATSQMIAIRMSQVIFAHDIDLRVMRGLVVAPNRQGCCVTQPLELGCWLAKLVEFGNDAAGHC